VGEAAQAPGTPPSARRRRPRAAALLAGATVLAGLLQGVQATGSQAREPDRADPPAAARTAPQSASRTLSATASTAAPATASTPASATASAASATASAASFTTAAPTGSHTATVYLDSVTPRVPTKDDSVTVSGTLVNNSKVTITHAHMALMVGPQGPLTSRSAMKAAVSRSGYVSAKDGDEIADHVAELADVPAGAGASFSLKVPVSALDLGSTGVYQLGVVLEGRTSVEPWQHALGIKRTFLPWYADGESAKPTRITYLWPLTDRPHIAARGDIDSQQNPIFLDDDLAAELAPGGRLQVMVDLAKNLPVTWVVDPDLLATVEAMTKGYRVAGPGGDVTHSTPGTGAALATQWLNALRGAVTGDEVIALPFGDTDLASLAHNGLHVPGSVAGLKTATQLGQVTVGTILGIKPTSGVGWPVDGAIDPSIVAAAKAGGDDRIIARSDHFPENTLEYTPTAARPVSGMTAVVADSSLSTAFSGDMLNAQASDQAVQSFVAQTLLITMQAPEKQRTLLVAPQRRPTVSQAQAMAEAIRTVDDDGSRWSQTVDFGTAASAHADSRVSHRVPAAASYPKALRARELPASAFRQLRTDQDRVNEFVVILTIKDRVSVPFRNAEMRAMSTGWRPDPSGGSSPGGGPDAKSYLDAIGVYFTDLINAVHIIDKKTALTLSGRSGTIPVTVKNELSQPITGLVLRLTSSTNIRLEIKNPDQPISIDGGHTRTLKFQTKASANGAVWVNAALYGPDGRIYGSSGIQFEIKVTKVTDLVMLIIAGGLLLLVLAGVRIYRQRKRQAASDGGGDDGAGGGEGSDTEEEDGGDPEHPGDPVADTGQESPEPSPAGEKVDG
jgi:hypothetical protein